MQRTTSNETDERGTLLSSNTKWVIGIIIALIINATTLAFAAGTLWTKVSAVEASIVEVKATLVKLSDSQYSASDAAKDFAMRDQRIDGIDSRVKSLESRK